LLALPPRAAGEKLLAGEFDVVWMIASWDAPMVQELLADERVTLSGFPRADATLVGLGQNLNPLQTSARGAWSPNAQPVQECDKLL